MITTEALHAMTSEDRTQLFERLAVALFGETGWPNKVATHFDHSRPTVFRWRREHNVPFSVIMALDAATQAEPALTDIVPALQALIEQQAAQMQTTERLIKALSDAFQRDA